MQYLVTKQPKQKYRSNLVSVVMVVEAKNGAEAVRLATAAGFDGGEDWFGPCQQYSAAKATPLQLNKLYRF